MTDLITNDDPSDNRPIGSNRFENNPKRRCTAHKANGDQCRHWARRGTNVCDYHGAKAPQVKRKAKQRLEEALDKMARELLGMATDKTIPEGLRLNAIRDVLDRGGLGAKTEVDVSLKPFEQILDRLAHVETGSRADYRRAQGIADDTDSIESAPQRELPAASDDLVDNDEIDHIEATGADLIVEAEDIEDIVIEAEVMSEGDELIAAMRTQPGPLGPTGPAGSGLLSLEDAVQAQRAIVRRVVRR